MADKDELVNQIKQLQRNDSDAKEQWWAYCDSELGGVKDPRRHDEAALMRFINSQGSGGMASSGMGFKLAPTAGRTMKLGGGGGGGKGGWGGGGGWGNGCSWVGGGGGSWGSGGEKGMMSMMQSVMKQSMGGGGGDIRDAIKEGQRASHSWKNAWQTYCALFGEGKNDPKRHSEEFLKAFFDYLGQLAENDLATAVSEVAGAGGVKRPMTGGGPAAKLMKTEENDLVTRVKQLQRSGPEKKQAWWDHCDQLLGGVRDPAKHDASVLQAWLLEHEE